MWHYAHAEGTGRPLAKGGFEGSNPSVEIEEQTVFDGLPFSLSHDLCMLFSANTLRLRPHGDDDCVREVAGVHEEDSDVAAGGHFGGGDGSRGGDVLQPDAEATCDLHGGKVGAAVK